VALGFAVASLVSIGLGFLLHWLFLTAGHWRWLTAKVLIAFGVGTTLSFSGVTEMIDPRWGLASAIALVALTIEATLMIALQLRLERHEGP
jgi:hypothetical protein